MTRCPRSRVALYLPLVVFAATAPVRAESFESFVEPFRRIELAPAETGVVAEIHVTEGAEVKAGQILVSLDQDVLDVSREIAQTAVDAEGRRKAALAEVRLREMKLHKIRELRRQGHASQEELLRAEAELESAEGQRRIVEEQHKLDLLELKKAEAMIERRLVRSPIDGLVTKLHREQGEFVTPIAPTVVTVVQVRPLRAVFNLPVDVAASLRTGEKVRITEATSTVEMPARVEYVAPLIDADSDTVRVKVLLDNPEGRIVAGSRCVLHLNGATTDGSLADR